MKPKFLLLIVLSAIIFTGLIEAITFQNIFPTTTPYVTSSSTVNLSYGIHAEDGLSSITHSWNGTNTTLFNESMIFYSAFENDSDLKEYTNGSTEATCGFVRNLVDGMPNATITGCNSTAGFVAENLTWGAGYGKNGGAFNFNGNKAYMTITNPPLDNFSQITVGVCFKSNDAQATNKGLIGKGYTTIGSFLVYLNAGTLNIVFKTVGGTKSSSITYVTIGNYDCFAMVYNGTSASLYMNGVYNKSFIVSTTGINYVNNTGELLIGQFSNANYWNGTIDNVFVSNVTWTSNQISEWYNTIISRQNETYWEYNTTQGTSAYSEPYFLCSKNSTLDEFCSATQNVRSVSTIISNFSTSKGIVNSDFYGTNTHGIWGSDVSSISLDGDAYKETASNSNWHRNLLLNSNIKILRADMWLDLSLSEGGSFNDSAPGSNYYDIDIRRGTVSFAKDNGLKVLFIADQIPKWLVDNTTGYCVNGSVTCPPSNYTKFGKLVVDYLQAVGCDETTCMVEVMNEPNYLGFWLGSLNYSAANCSIRSVEYNKLYNATYDEIKKVYPNMLVGGISVMDGATCSAVMLDNFLSNFSSKMDFLTYHKYSTSTGGGVYLNDMNTVYTSLLLSCTTYSANCSKIIIGETNVNSVLNYNNFDNYTSEYSTMWLGALNSYPQNLSIIQFQWSDWRNYTFQDEYPSRWYMVSEPLLDNEIRPIYNATSNFAHLCPAGATVYVSSNDDDSIKQVSCKKSSNYSLIIINTDTNSRNLTWDGTGTSTSDVAYLMDIETGNLYLNNNTNQLGILNSYGIKYLSTPLLRMDETNGLTKIAPTGEEYTSFEINVSSKTIEDTKVTYHIASNLSISQNVLITLKPYTDYGSYCVNVKKVEYTPKGGSKTTWNNEEAKATCYKLATTGYTLEVSPSLSSNELVFTYGTGLSSPSNPFNSAFSFLWNIGGLLIIILLIGVIFIFMWAKQINIMQGIALIAGVILSAYILGIFLEAIA